MTDQKYRHEMKYLITQGQLEVLRSRLSGMLPLDPHAGSGRGYSIRSLYFDDIFNRCYYENLNGTDPKEKFRIRIYNGSDERISLECKRKENGKTLKSACLLTREQCLHLMNGEAPWDIETQPQVLRKLMIEMELHRMRPAVIVEYDRIPYVCSAGNVRITLDTSLSSSDALTEFLNETVPRRPVMAAGQQLLEVKYDEFLPDYIYRALQLESLRQTAYSKYFLCRKYTL